MPLAALTEDARSETRLLRLSSVRQLNSLV